MPVRVVLDPGHGGDQSGTRGPRGTLEKDVNLQVARVLAQRLRALGLPVILTREGDEERTLEERVAVDGDLWISIHHNATAQGPPRINRGEFYIPLARPHPSWELAREVIRSFRDPRWPFAPDPEPLPATYRVLVPERVSLLVEACYLFHEEGEAFLLGEGPQLEAELLARGVETFLERTEGTVPRVVRMERERDLLRFVLEGPVEASTLEVRVGGTRLPLEDLHEGVARVRIPRDFPGGRWTLEARFHTPAGVPSLPFRATVSVEQPVQSFVIRAYPLSYKVPAYVRIRVMDGFGQPAPEGLRVGLRLSEGRILERDERTRQGGEVHAVVELPRGSGVLEVDLPGFSGMGQLTYQERRTYQYGKVLDARTRKPVEGVTIQTRSGVFRSLPGGWFFVPGKGDLTFRARGYASREVETVQGEEVLLEPLLSGVLHRKIWLEGPRRVVEVLRGWLDFFGAEVVVPEEGTSRVDRVFYQNAEEPAFSLLLEEGEETTIGFFPGVLEARSEQPARMLAHSLNRMGWGHRVQSVSFYRLIHYGGPRVVIRRDAYPPAFLHVLFAALVHLFGGPEPWKRVVRVHQDDRGVSGVPVRIAGSPLWTLTGREGIAHVWSPFPDPEILIPQGAGTLEVLE